MTRTLEDLHEHFAILPHDLDAEARLRRFATSLVQASTAQASTVHASTVHASTVHASTVHASTVHASTVHASTVHASTVHAGTVQAGTVQTSTAEPEQTELEQTELEQTELEQRGPIRGINEIRLVPMHGTEPAGRRRHRGWLVPAVAATVLVAVAAATLSEASPAKPPPAAPAAARPSAAILLRPDLQPQLVPATPTPPAAPFSLALVPHGWRLLTWDRSHISLAGPDRPAEDFYFGLVGNLDVSYQETELNWSSPIRVAAGPVSFPSPTPGQGTAMIIRVRARRIIVVQVPPTLPLSRAQLLELGNGITLRSNAVASRG